MDSMGFLIPSKSVLTLISGPLSADISTSALHIVLLGQMSLVSSGGGLNGGAISFQVVTETELAHPARGGYYDSSRDINRISSEVYGLVRC